MSQDKYISACDGLYSSEVSIEEDNLYMIGVITANRIKGNKNEDIISNINKIQSVFI